VITDQPCASGCCLIIVAHARKEEDGSLGGVFSVANCRVRRYSVWLEAWSCPDQNRRLSVRILGASSSRTTCPSNGSCLHTRLHPLAQPLQSCCRPMVSPLRRDRDRMCAVWFHPRGACGRTDRALGWLAIGYPGTRGQHACLCLTSLVHASCFASLSSSSA
jgi:hypothetical protein